MRRDIQKAWDETPATASVAKRCPTPEEFESLIPSSQNVLALLKGVWFNKVDHPNPLANKSRIQFATFVLTDSMIHMFGKNEVIGSRSRSQDAVALQNVTSISSFTRRILAGQEYSVEIIRAGDKDQIQVDKEGEVQVQKFVTLARQAISDLSSASVQQSVSSETPIEALKKLKELLDLGILTPSEFEEKRLELLKRI